MGDCKKITPNIIPLELLLDKYQTLESDAAFNGDADLAQAFYNKWINIERRIKDGEIYEVMF